MNKVIRIIPRLNDIYLDGLRAFHLGMIYQAFTKRRAKLRHQAELIRKNEKTMAHNNEKTKKRITV